LPLVLKDGGGLFDESRAARLTTASPGEVCLVGDLGGGTLDLFVAADNGGGKELKEVADSVRIGGNLLLRQIAANPDGYLPNDGGWIAGNGEPGYTEARLRAWMRSEGCHRLFGLEAGGRPSLQPLGVLGFNKAAEGAKARQLIDRYFRLVAEYMARHLVAFLVGQWFPLVGPDHYERLRISVQLRGNGWRLRYQKESHEQTSQAIQDLVRQRLSALWAEVPGNPYPAPLDDRFWESPRRFWVPDPKRAPIKSVVGKAMPYEDVIGNWHTHTLVDLEVRRNGGFKHVAWYSEVPFDTGKSTQVELKGITPPLLLSSPAADQKVEIRSLEATLQGKVNGALQTEGIVDEGDAKFRAPVGPLVWEAVFGSMDFWPGRGKK
jgi:hypothetical protein